MGGKKTGRVLAYSPAGLELEKGMGWGTLLFACSRACNLNCEGCWTSVTTEEMARRLSARAEWLYNGMIGLNVLEAILQKFRKEGGRLVACMSDGEPLHAANYPFTLELAKACGKLELPLLLFTNGTMLSEQKVWELGQVVNGRLSFCVSMQTGIRDRYAGFMIVSGSKSVGEKIFTRIEENFRAWKAYDTKTLAKTGKHGIAIHSYVIPGKTCEEDLQEIAKIAECLGGVPWVVGTMGVNVIQSLINGKVASDKTTLELVKKYDTGPTATLKFGSRENEKLCSYIAHGFYPFKERKGVFGITFNPFNNGQVQTCPYHSVIGTSKWLGLKEFLTELRKKREVTESDVWEWLENAVEVETKITRAAFDLVGYEHCLMRHSKQREIDAFIVRVNCKMARWKEASQGVEKTEEYFNSLHTALDGAIGEAKNSQARG